MKRHPKLITCAIILGLTLAGACSEEPPVNQVGVNVVEKSIFEGSWYVSRTVIDVDYESAGLGTFPGDTASDFAGGLTTLPRIRWVIDEDYLFAYRDYEMTLGGDGAPRERDYLGQPVAAFAIQSHFDIKRQYNPNTGEELNVVYEDAADKRWYERQFMRVDWSKNLIPGYYGLVKDLYEIIGFYNHEPADLYVQRESDFPDSWRPQFNRMPCAGSTDTASAGCTDQERDWADDYAQNELYSMSFVTQEIVSPGNVPDPFTGAPMNWCLSVYSDAPQCASNSIYVRTSFLKVSDKRQYVAENWNDNKFERHGYFRLEQPTWDRSTGDPTDPSFFGTDFLNFGINRHNIWKNWRNDDGSPIPYASRQVRQIVWHTTPELPAHLVKPAFDLVSEWNGVMMNTVRLVQGKAPAVFPRVDCQTADPDSYCYCQTNPEDPSEILNPTCVGQYDPFEPPAAAAARGVENPYDCYVEVPAGAEPDMTDPGLGATVVDHDFYGWFGAKMVGAECVNLLRLNTCNRGSVATNGGTTDGLECQERGDMRFKFLSYVDQPGTDFLGIATMRGDPITGETITGDANIGGPALDGYRTRAMQQYDLLTGRITDREYIVGEDVRGYFESLGGVQHPAPPRIDFNVALRNGTASPVEVTALHDRMDSIMERANQLRGPEGRASIYSDRVQRLVGTDLERRLTSSAETLVRAGVLNANGHTPTDINDAILDRASPFRTNAHEQLAHFDDLESKAGRLGLHLPNEYIDDSVMWYINNHRDWPRARVEFSLNRLLYRETQVHEMGHCMGLRHDFGGTVDTDNYTDDYYVINQRFPLPDPASFDSDPGTPGLTATDQRRYEDAYNQTKHLRELAGIDGTMNSSIMDYTANWYERVSTAGRYDFAAIAFGYGDIVELYDNSAGLAMDAINPYSTPRTWTKYYNGGEACESDADCPYAEGGSRSGELLAANIDSGLTQHCVANPRVPSRTMCSGFDSDLSAIVETGGSTPRWAPVSYMFCSDERATGLSTRAGTLGWCNRFDEGDSYREIVKNVAESYDRMYLFSNFRRYRRSFGFGGYILDQVIGRRFVILQNIYQNLIYQYASDPAFRANPGAFGFADEFMAAVDVLNFYAHILGQPDVGSYTWNNSWKRYQRSSPDPEMTGADLSMPVGMGRYFGSVYQSGLSGIYRVERIGTFYDKLYTVLLMTERGAVTSYTRDVPFYTNFYDIFPNEMEQIFNGMIRDVPEEYMPRITCSDPASFPHCANPRLEYMDFYRGDCATSATCRPDPVETTYRGMNVLDGGGSIVLQLYAAIYGLSEFPVFFDTTFQNQLFVCVEGQGDCHATSGTDGTDYIRYTSSRFARTFLAWQVEPAPGQPEQISIGFAMVKEANDLDFILRMLLKYRDGPVPYSRSNLTGEELARLDSLAYVLPSGGAATGIEIDRLEGRLYDLESFFEQLIQLEREIGITSYLRF